MFFYDPTFTSDSSYVLKNKIFLHEFLSFRGYQNIIFSSVDLFFIWFPTKILSK